MWKSHGGTCFTCSFDLMHCGESGVVAGLLASFLSELIDGGGLAGRKHGRLDTRRATNAANCNACGDDITKVEI